MDSKIITLGTGNPNPDPERYGPAVAITIDETLYLIDCGAGVVRRVVSAGIPVSKIIRVFLTHLHSDHTIGYRDIILTPGVIGRDEPLQVFGPKGLTSMTEHILAAYDLDIKERLEGLEPAIRENYIVHTHEIEQGEIYHDSNVTVDAFRVDHGTLASYGFKFSLPDRTVVISGDTKPSEALVENAKGCDVLIHEVYSAKGLRERTAEWRKYHSSVHTSTVELAEIANRVRPGLLVLYHQLFMKQSEEDLVQEISKYYDGRIVSSKDLDVF